MINPSEFKSLVTFKVYDNGKAIGGAPKRLSIIESLEVWAKFEQVGGSTQPLQAQMMSDVTARITCRYNAAFTTNWVVIVEGQEYTIKFIKTDDPAYKRFMIIDCAVSLGQTSWS